ncbi:MAG: hypothetical protein J6Y94_03460, partial [Bacteriovoracaceae bacterium]|nr:hypothetical protein [Bacteriovoracaceae bacterium]
FFLGTWYLADPDFYASPIKHNLNLIAQYQRKVPVYLEAATLLTSGITELARLPRPLYTKGHARITLYPDARIFVPRTLRPKTEFAAYLGRTLNLYQTWQEIQKAIPGSKTWANSIGHLRRSYFKLSFEVASRLAEINLIIYHLMEEGRAVNFQVHERYHCLEIVVAPVDYLAGFYYSLYLPFQEAKVPTTKAEILQLKILQDL